MDLSLPISSAKLPSLEEIRFKMLSQAADQAVSYQHHDNWYGAICVTVRPSGWWQALRRRTVWRRVWQMPESPFEGLCIGEDRKFYMLSEDERTPSATAFVIKSCTPEDIYHITLRLYDMAAPAPR